MSGFKIFLFIGILLFVIVTPSVTAYKVIGYIDVYENRATIREINCLASGENIPISQIEILCEDLADSLSPQYRVDFGVSAKEHKDACYELVDNLKKDKDYIENGGSSRIIYNYGYKPDISMICREETFW
jgi:hypothetical protein